MTQKCQSAHTFWAQVSQHPSAWCRSTFPRTWFWDARHHERHTNRTQSGKHLSVDDDSPVHRRRGCQGQAFNKHYTQYQQLQSNDSQTNSIRTVTLLLPYSITTTTRYWQWWAGIKKQWSMWVVGAFNFLQWHDIVALVTGMASIHKNCARYTPKFSSRKSAAGKWGNHLTRVHLWDGDDCTDWLWYMANVQARSFGLQDEAERKSIVSGISH